MGAGGGDWEAVLGELLLPGFSGAGAFSNDADVAETTGFGGAAGASSFGALTINVLEVLVLPSLSTGLVSVFKIDFAVGGTVVSGVDILVGTVLPIIFLSTIGVGVFLGAAWITSLETGLTIFGAAVDW